MGLNIACLQGMKAVGGLTQSRSQYCVSLLPSSCHTCVFIACTVRICSLMPMLLASFEFLYGYAT